MIDLFRNTKKRIVIERKGNNEGNICLLKIPCLLKLVAFAMSAKQRDSPADTDKQGNCQ